jgi:NitT/TauT family transport system substrate-binding protein
VIYAPYLVAMEKGYYANEGLDIEVQIAGGGVATPAQLAGSIDVNTSGPVALSPILRGAPLKIVYTEATHPVYQLWSTSHDLKALKDLKGKQVGIISRGDTFEISMKLALLRAKLPLDWVGYTALGGFQNLLPAFIAHSLPAVVLTDVDVAEAKRRGVLGQGELLDDWMHDLPMPYSGIAVTDAYLKDHADVVRGFLRATMQGVRYMKKYKAQTIAIVEKFNQHPNQSIDEIDYDETIPLLTKDGTVPNDVLRQDMEVRAAILEIPKDKIPPVSRAYDYSIVRAVNAELDKSGWTPQP